MKRLNSVGASHVAFIAAVLVVLAVGFAGYRVTGKQSNNATKNAATVQPTKYKSVSDVKNASKELDSADVDKGLDSSSLDGDLNDLL